MLRVNAFHRDGKLENIANIAFGFGWMLEVKTSKTSKLHWEFTIAPDQDTHFLVAGTSSTCEVICMQLPKENLLICLPRK